MTVAPLDHRERRACPLTRKVTLALTVTAVAVLGVPRVAVTQTRVAVSAEGGVDRPIGRDARRARPGPVVGVSIEAGDAKSTGAFLATLTYASMASRPYRGHTNQGDLDLWGLTLGGVRRTSTARPLGVLATIAAGVVIVEEATRSFSFGDIPPRTNWEPLLSAGLGAEYRRAALQLRLRSELWVQPLTYSRDGYGARAAVRTTLGIGFVRK